MAQDKLGGIIRALVGVPKDYLTIIQWVINLLNKKKEYADDFHADLSTFVFGWKLASNQWMLDRHPDQKSNGHIQGFTLEKYYCSPQFEGRLMSIESPLVKFWIENPEKYPKQLRDKEIFLWGSRRDVGGDNPMVAYFFWDNEVVTNWCQLDARLSGSCHALLERTP